MLSQTLKRIFAVLALVVLFSTVSIIPRSVQAADVASHVKPGCSYFDAWPVDEGGGTFTNRNYFIYVAGTTDPRGRIQMNGLRIHWKPVGIRNGYLAFGVSTAYTYANPLWKLSAYKYELCV